MWLVLTLRIVFEYVRLTSWTSEATVVSSGSSPALLHETFKSQKIAYAMLYKQVDKSKTTTKIVYCIGIMSSAVRMPIILCILKQFHRRLYNSRLSLKNTSIVQFCKDR